MKLHFPESAAPVAPPWAVRSAFLLTVLFPVGAVALVMAGSVIYTLLAVLCLAFAAPVWQTASRFERNMIIAYGLLFAVAALSLINSTDLDLGLQKLDRFLRIATLGLLFLGLRRFGTLPGRWFILSVGLGTLVVAGQAWYQTEYLDWEVAQGLYHKIIFGDSAMLLAVVLAVALCTLSWRRLEALFLLAGIGAALYASVMSHTRGAWLFVPVALLLIGWLNRRRFGRRYWIGLGVSIALVGAILFTQANPVTRHLQQGLQELAVFQEDPSLETSWGIRLNLWRNALIIWAEHPILGTGLGDFELDNRHMVREGESLTSHVNFGHAHSIYFDALATTGALGFVALVIAFLALPFQYFLKGWKAAGDPWTRFYTLGGLMTVAAFAVFGLSEGLLARNAFVNHYVMYLAVFWAGASAGLSVAQARSAPHGAQNEFVKMPG